MLAGIRHILIITTPHEQDPFKTTARRRPRARDRDPNTRCSPPRRAGAGVSDRPRVRRRRTGLRSRLGDNIFYGAHFSDYLRRRRARGRRDRLRIPGPRSRAVRRRRVRRSADARSASKRSRGRRKSSFAVTGLYFYDNQVVDIAAALKPRRAASWRSPTSIAPISNAAELRVEKLRPRHGLARHGDARVAACRPANFVQAVEERQGLMIGCLEEIAYRLGYITTADLNGSATVMQGSADGQYPSSALSKTNA